MTRTPAQLNRMAQLDAEQDEVDRRAAERERLREPFLWTLNRLANGQPLVVFRTTAELDHLYPRKPAMPPELHPGAVVDRVEGIRRAAQALKRAIRDLDILHNLGNHGAARAGYIVVDDVDERWTCWASFPRLEGETEDAARDRVLDVANDLGWRHFDRGIGRAYANDPYIRVSRTRALLQWTGGLDI